jgi:UPF0755 protein
MSRKGFAVVAALTMLATLMAGRLSFLLSVPVGIYPPVTFEISAGESPAEVAARLEEAGVIRSARALLLMARFRGKDRLIRHGVHEFGGALSPTAVLMELIRPPRASRRVIIREGMSWADIGLQLERDGILDADEYARAVCEPSFLALSGAHQEANCAEGFLFPDTYSLVPGMSARALVRLQLRKFNEVIAELARDTGLDRDGLNRVLILASIIEKETSRASERELIASVFHNRLGRQMRLQADPTVIYGVLRSNQPWTGNLKREHLRLDGPYNTYRRQGLPAGPISNPGRGALEAALRPAKTDYLYFVARRDGRHHFSRTLAEHNRAVREHQLRR